jgi:hypothetical protein
MQIQVIILLDASSSFSLCKIFASRAFTSFAIEATIVLFVNFQDCLCKVKAGNPATYYERSKST